MNGFYHSATIAPAAMPSLTLEEVLQLIKETLLLGALLGRMFLTDLFKFAQQFFLARIQIYRSFDLHMTEQIARHAPAHGANTFVLQAEDLSGLRLSWHLEQGLAVEGGDFKFATQSRR